MIYQGPSGRGINAPQYASGLRRPRNRPFHNDTINAVERAPLPFGVGMVWTLVSGNIYEYIYLPSDLAMAQYRASICRGTPPPGYRGKTGGKYYNASIRGGLVIKELV